MSAHIITPSSRFNKIQVLEKVNHLHFSAFYHVCSELLT